MPFVFAIDDAVSTIEGDFVTTVSTSNDQQFIGRMSRSAFRKWIETTKRMLDAADCVEQRRIATICGKCPTELKGDCALLP